MRRIPLLWAVGLALATGRSSAEGPCCKTRCLVTPPSPCCDCSPGTRRCLLLYSPEYAQKLLDKLGGEWCQRLAAVEKLGSRFHADYCKDPAVLEALLTALQCDTCWKVRYAAAWSIMGQKALVPEAVLALYLAARLDNHYMVRTRAEEALDILTLGRQPCYKQLYAAADVLITELKARNYVTGSKGCRVCLGQCFGQFAIAGPAPKTKEPESTEPEKIKVPKPVPRERKPAGPEAVPTITVLPSDSQR